MHEREVMEMLNETLTKSEMPSIGTILHSYLIVMHLECIAVFAYAADLR